MTTQREAESVFEGLYSTDGDYVTNGTRLKMQLEANGVSLESLAALGVTLPWNAITTWPEDAVVTDRGGIWRATGANTDSRPISGNTDWELIGGTPYVCWQFNATQHRPVDLVDGEWVPLGEWAAGGIRTLNSAPVDVVPAAGAGRLVRASDEPGAATFTCTETFSATPTIQLWLLDDDGDEVASSTIDLAFLFEGTNDGTGFAAGLIRFDVNPATNTTLIALPYPLNVSDRPMTLKSDGDLDAQGVGVMSLQIYYDIVPIPDIPAE